MERMIPKGLEPELVYEIFEEISRIPRPSGHEEEISDWLVAFAEKYHLSSVQDRKGNVLIRKAGTPGKEDHPGVILQSHMDMVCEKTKDSDHDFLKDPIQITVEGYKRPLWVRITALDWLFRWRFSLWRMHRIRRWKCW